MIDQSDRSDPSDLPLNTDLPFPARYTPFADGVYKTAAGLMSLDKNFGNGPVDNRVFQIDEDFGRFRENLERARHDTFSKYYCVAETSEAVMSSVALFIARQLVLEYPDWFSLSRAQGGYTFESALTHETCAFDDRFKLINSEFASAFDALASQVQEDLAIVVVGDMGDTLVAVHVTAPNHWAPHEKLGKNFVGVHEPVAGISELNANAPKLMRALTAQGPYQRFAWGLATDTRLNRYPVKDESIRSFDPANPTLFVRVERQVTKSFAEVSAFLFCIRTYFMDCSTLSKDLRTSLVSALRSMTQPSREYKGIASGFDEMISWLEET